MSNTKNDAQAIPGAEAVSAKPERKKRTRSESGPLPRRHTGKGHQLVANKPGEVRKRALFEIRLRGDKGASVRRIQRAHRAIPAEMIAAELELMRADGLVVSKIGQMGATVWVIAGGGA